MPYPLGVDYYALLGVDTSADHAELRRAWRRMAARYHPDRAGEGATAMFQQLSAAYEVLSDPLARARYDRKHRENTCATAPHVAAAARTSAAPPARAAAPAAMLGRLCGALPTLIACGVARLDDVDDVITLVLTGSEAARGGMVTISMRVELWCPRCAAHGRPSIGCTRCGGTRTVEELYSAWLAVTPGATPGEVLIPSAELPGMIQPVRFRVAITQST